MLDPCSTPEIAGLAMLVVSIIALIPFSGCGGDGGTGAGGGGGGNPLGPDRPDDTGAACKAASDCYPGIDTSKIPGDVDCLDRIPGGYCTQTCSKDTDCCAVAGECKAKIHDVCSPFESEKRTLCFLSCEHDDLFPPAGESGSVDEQEFCQREAGRAFICRSSGGGSDNRKICVPGDCSVGAACGGDADCASGLSCITSLTHGYCGAKGCSSSDACPSDSLCVKHPDGNDYCLKRCEGESDCTFCRGVDDPIACTGGVNFVGTGASGKVCMP